MDVTPKDIAKGLFMNIKTDTPVGFEIPGNKRPRVENELTYLSMFIVDLGVYLTIGHSAERNQIMDEFWSLVSSSGTNTEDVGSRLQAYSDAARTDDPSVTYEKLGKVFAWHCLAQETESISRVGSYVAQTLLDEVMTYTKQHIPVS